MDLFTLREKFAYISSLPLIIRSELKDKPRGMILNYTEKINLAGKSAGWLVTDEFLFFGKIVQENCGEELLIGPASEYFLTYEAKKSISDELGLKGNKALSFRQQLSNIPKIKLTDCIHQLAFLNYIINGDDSLSTYSNNSTPAPNHFSAVQFNESIHNTSQFENYVFSCVEFGKPELLEEMFASQEITKYSTGVTATNTMRAQKNLFIVSTTLVSRAAIRGGLDYELALSLSDIYINQIEEAKTYNEFDRMLREMIIDFARRVAELRLRSDSSPTVRAAVQIISGRINQKIKVEQIASELGVNRSYLSHHFIKEMGESMSSYIARCKINEAIRLMKTTDMSLADIAYRLSFSSQSHFHSTFKKVTGENPGKYQRQ